MSDTPSLLQAGHAPPGAAAVLIVDGSELGGLLAAVLQRHGVTALALHSGKDAALAVKQHRPKLVITEWDLPDGPPVELMSLLEQGPVVPLILMAHAPSVTLPAAGQAAAAVAVDFFQKPLHTRLLLGSVKRVLGLEGASGTTPGEGLAVPVLQREDATNVPVLDEVTDPGSLPHMEGGELEGSLFGVESGGEEVVLDDADVAAMEEVTEAEHSAVVVEDFETLAGRARAAPVSLPPMPAPGPAHSRPPEDGRVAEQLTVSPVTQPDVPTVVPVSVPPPVAAVAAAVAAGADEPVAVVGTELPDEADPSAMMSRLLTRSSGSVDPPAAAAPAQWEPVGRSARSAPALGAAPATSGTLTETPLHMLLDALYTSGASGVLLLRAGAAQRRLGFSAGSLTAAASNLQSEQVTALAVASGLVTEAQCRAALEDVNQRPRAVLDHLVGTGVVSAQAALRVLGEQRSRIVRAAWAANLGEFSVTLGAVPLSAGLPPVFLGDVILRGLMSAAVLQNLRHKLGPELRLVPRTDGAYPLERLTLSADEAHLVIACDGTKTVADLLTLSDLSELSALALLDGLAFLRVVRPLAAPPSRKSYDYF